MKAQGNAVLRVLLVDDHRLVADGISSLLRDPEFIASVGVDTHVEAVYSAQHAAERIRMDAGHDYDLILLDLSMPGLSGFDLLGLLAERSVRTPVIVLSASNNTPDMQRAHELGAHGYICKFESSHEMLRRIRAVIEGKRSFPQEFVPQPATSNPAAAIASALTQRQLEVLELIAGGKSNKEIASLLDVTMATVKFHVAALFRQLEVRNRTMCVREAMRLGLLRETNTSAAAISPAD